ncbi:MAG: C25 family cysteine peptidase, partial [Desulfobacterales bacterium]|nr:C25 family cysteine peptidase [Desulfobacterales bacterium]
MNINLSTFAPKSAKHLSALCSFLIIILNANAKITVKEETTNQEIKVSYEFAPILQENTKQGTVLSMEGLYNYHEEGQPVVPYHLAKIALPFGKTVESIQVEFFGSKTTLLNTQVVITRTQGFDDYVVAVSTNTFPASNYRNDGVELCRGIAVANVLLFPVEISADRKSMTTYNSASLTIKLKDEQAYTEVKPRVNEYLQSISDNNIHKLKHADLPLFKSKQAGICNSADSYRYVIITSEEFKSDTDPYSLSALKNFRISKGMSATIVTTTDIYANYTGDDNPEKIRNFIKDAYNNWETDYVLLGGDTPVIPARMLYARNKYIASDMYYGCLDGDFNANGDTLWGQADDDLDFVFDVHVGRASAEDLTEIRNFVYKTITYENSPINASYHTKMLQYNQISGGVGDTWLWALKYRHLSENLTVDFYKIKDADGGQLDKRLTTHNVGYYLGASHGTIEKLGYMSHAKARSYKNADQFYFAATIACLSGRFEKNTVAEHWLTSTRTGGAFAGFFNSVTSYAPFIMHYVHFKMRDSYFVDDITVIGDLRSVIATQYSSGEYSATEGKRYQAYEFNLLGDPAVEWKMKKSKPVDIIYDFEESPCKDQSGNNHHGQLVGGADIYMPNTGNYAKFDGTDDYIQCDYSTWNPMGDQTELTIAGGIYPLSFKDNAGLVVKGTEGNPFKLCLTNDGKVQFKLNNGNPWRGLQSGSWTSTSSVALNEWSHVAVTINNHDTTLNFYINGNLDRKQKLPGGYIMGHTREPLYIGAD